jgi:predicted phosphodiesterase
VSLDEVDIPSLESLADEGIPETSVIDGWLSDIRTGFARAVVRGLLAAMLAGAFSGFALKRSRRAVLYSAGVATLVPALLVVFAAMTFSVEGFRTPTFRGAVSYAPSLIELVQRRAEDVESLRDQVDKLATDLSRYYASPQSFASAGALEGTYRVLHVTDLHLDPVGLELAEQLAEEFAVSLVIDTGDINHYGSPVEGAVVASQVPTDLPRAFIPGNHDSPAIVGALRALPNVRVLDGVSEAFEGMVVFGVGDPASAGVDATPQREAVRSLAARQAGALRESIASGSPTPTVVAVHSGEMATYFDGLAQIVLAGHTHTPELRRMDESWYLNSGTTGGIHFSRMRAEPHIPHSASILYFTRQRPHQLIAIDQIEVYGLVSQSSLKRTVVDESLLP